jgi:hypothetical protein
MDFDFLYTPYPIGFSHTSGGVGGKSKKVEQRRFADHFNRFAENICRGIYYPGLLMSLKY